MHLQESGEMYLKTIYILSLKNEHVRSLDVAEYMHFSKPSISRAMKLLKEAKYIKIDDNGHITLTDEGSKIALKMYERHKILTDFFQKIGVSEKTASDDACKIEHDISDETFQAIIKHTKK